MPSPVGSAQPRAIGSARPHVELAPTRATAQRADCNPPYRGGARRGAPTRGTAACLAQPEPLSATRPVRPTLQAQAREAHAEFSRLVRANLRGEVAETLQRYAAAWEPRLAAWLSRIDALRTAPNGVRVREAQRLVQSMYEHRHDFDVPGTDPLNGYVLDPILHARADAWTPPLQTVVSGFGDCEDWAILKYYTLRAMGVPEEQLMIVVGRLANGTGHALLGHLEGGRLTTLDIDVAEPVALEERRDFIPAFALSGERQLLLSRALSGGDWAAIAAPRQLLPTTRSFAEWTSMRPAAEQTLRLLSPP